MGHLTIIVNNYKHLMVFPDIKMTLGIKKNRAIGPFGQQPVELGNEGAKNVAQAPSPATK
jgi:hypothetical protein